MVDRQPQQNSLGFKTFRGQEADRKSLEVNSDMRRKQLPLLPSQQTTYVMGKAAVAVYYVAVEYDDCGHHEEGPVDA
jgi:hypothetical protein